MKPNYTALTKYLTKHLDYVIESEVRDKLNLVDFTSMSDEEMDQFNTWLQESGYESVVYVDKMTRLLNGVWINQKYQDAIERLRSLEKNFHRDYPRSHISKRRVDQIADEAMEIITTLHSMVLAQQEVTAE